MRSTTDLTKAKQPPFAFSYQEPREYEKAAAP